VTVSEEKALNIGPFFSVVALSAAAAPPGVARLAEADPVRRSRPRPPKPARSAGGWPGPLGLARSAGGWPGRG
jgi:hypothetical protein